MKIEGVNRVHETYKVQAMENVSRKDAVKGKDEVALSKNAKDYLTVSKLVAETSDVRQDKVDAIKAKMKDGTYNVTAEDVARKILSRLK